MALGIDLWAAPLIPERTQYAHHLGDPSVDHSEMELGRESARFIFRCRSWNGGDHFGILKTGFCAVSSSNCTSGRFRRLGSRNTTC